jgi:hypothetical protein
MSSVAQAHQPAQFRSSSLICSPAVTVAVVRIVPIRCVCISAGGPHCFSFD